MAGPSTYGGERRVAAVPGARACRRPRRRDLEGPGEPIMLTLYGPDGEVAVPLLPKRALTLAQELLTCGVAAIKADQWDTPPPA